MAGVPQGLPRGIPVLLERPRVSDASQMIFFPVGNLLQALEMCSPFMPGGTTRGTPSATWGLSSPLQECSSSPASTANSACSLGLELLFYDFKTLAAHNSSRDQPVHPDPPSPQSF